MKNDYPDKTELLSNLKPAGSYLNNLSDLTDLLGTIKQAENAAKEMIDETKSVNSVSAAGEYPCIKPSYDASVPNPQPSAPNECNTPYPQEQNEATIELLIKKLDMLIGLDNIKQSVKSLINYVKVRKLREKNSLPNPPISLHMVFTGNPGTGKTTVARILAELYRTIGVLSKGQLIEVDRSGLVAGFVGQTALKTAEVVRSALGGILFIDEAYALAPETSGGNDFGREGIETLLKMMEDHRDDFIVIVAGYSKPMKIFISSNPGLESRFNRYFNFPDYNSEQLFCIFDSMCIENEYILTKDAVDFALDHFNTIYNTRDENFGNARHVRNFFENMVTEHSDRISMQEDYSRNDLTSVLCEDLARAALHDQSAQ